MPPADPPKAFEVGVPTACPNEKADDDWSVGAALPNIPPGAPPKILLPEGVGAAAAPKSELLLGVPGCDTAPNETVCC